MASSNPTSEFPVNVPKDVKKVFNVLRFAGSADIPAMLKHRRLLMRREDNSRQQVQVASAANDIIPKTGAGSEFGKEERDERTRRLRGGRTHRKYNPDDQPWIASFVPPASKETKPESSTSALKPRRFRGSREAGATENSSWFIFAQRPDKSFVALPISEWYSFAAMTQYDHLNSDEVEEEFQKRKKTLNFFQLMLQKRLKNQDMEPGELEAQVKEEAALKGGRRGMHLTDLDAEWVNEGDDDFPDGDDDEDKKGKSGDANKGIADADAQLDIESGSKKRINKKKAAELLRKSRRQRSRNADGGESDITDSDEGDFDGREMDYMTSSGAESELEDAALPDDVKEEVEAAETAELGVEDEEGLRKLNDSAEEDEDEDTKDSKDDDLDLDEKESRSRQGVSSSDSEGNDSNKDDDSDSDIERLELSASGRQLGVGNSGGKRRLQGEVITASGKRVRLELPSSTTEGMVQSASSSGSAGSSTSSKSVSGGSDIDSQLEQAIKHYLGRTPMTATQLVEKFLQKARAYGSMPVSSADLPKRIAAIILRLKPEQIRSNNAVYFSLSPDANKTDKQ